MPDKIRIAVTVNGTAHDVLVEPRTLLLDFLRDELALTGAHAGCEQGVCGACTVLVDGEPTRACLMFAAQLDGAEVTTVESLASPDGTLHPIQRAFTENHGLQCGFCTPGHAAWPPAPCWSTTRTPSRRTSARPCRQPLPLHRLPEHRAVGRRRGGRGMSYKYDRQADPPQGRPEAADRTRGLHRRRRRARHAARRRAAQPARPRPHPLDRRERRAGASRRGLRPHRRRGAGAHRADGRVLRRARAADRDRHGEGALPRRGRRRRRGHRPLHRRGRPRADRGRLRGARAGRRPDRRDGARRRPRARHPRQQRRVPPQPRLRRRRGGLRPRRHRRAPQRALAPHGRPRRWRPRARWPRGTPTPAR